MYKGSEIFQIKITVGVNDYDLCCMYTNHHEVHKSEVDPHPCICSQKIINKIIHPKQLFSCLRSPGFVSQLRSSDLFSPGMRVSETSIVTTLTKAVSGLKFTTIDVSEFQRRNVPHGV